MGKQGVTMRAWPVARNIFDVPFDAMFVGLQPTVIASRAPHLLLEQSKDSKNRGRASPVNAMSYVREANKRTTIWIKQGATRASQLAKLSNNDCIAMTVG